MRLPKCELDNDDTDEHDGQGRPNEVSSLSRGLQATEERWKQESWSFPGKSTKVSAKWSVLKTYIQVTMYVFNELYLGIHINLQIHICMK